MSDTFVKSWSKAKLVAAINWTFKSKAMSRSIPKLQTCSCNLADTPYQDKREDLSRKKDSLCILERVMIIFYIL